MDLQVARFIYGTNSSFRVVEHPEFKKLINMLRPGYNLPTRQTIADNLLDSVYNTLQNNLKEQLAGKTVCMALDGWSNVHNDSIICVCVTEISSGNVHLIATIDTLDNSHTWDYLTSLAVNSIKSCEQFGCTVGSLVTDNAANMHKMRSNLATHNDLLVDIITYGCSAHLLNLLAQDLQIPGIKSFVKKIIKYFKYTHFFSAKFKMAGGKALVLPQDVRWNTLADSIQSYIDNWPILYSICVENRAGVNSNILKAIENIDMKNQAEVYLVKLKKIAAALDRIQSNTCSISEATDTWLALKDYFELEVNDDKLLEYFQNRYNLAITEYHFLSYMLDHRYQGNKLTQIELDSTLDYVNIYHPAILPEIIQFQAQASPFSKYLFNELTIQNVTPLTWWTSMQKRITPELFNLTQKMYSAVASSAGLERLFSSFGLVHSKLRNKLGVEKASKVVSIFKCLNSNKTTETEEI